MDGNMAVPDKGFKLTLEMLRRKPDSALIWYEDFQDYGVLETDYWTVRSGSFEVWRSDEYSMERVYSQLEGHGELAWQYDGFSELHLRARLAFPANGSGRAGVFCGSLFCCLNYDTQAVELYNGSTLLGSYSQEIARTASADLRDNPPCTRWRCVSVGTGCGCIPAHPIPCALRQRSAALQEAMPDTARTTRPCVSFCVWGTPDLRAV